MPEYNYIPRSVKKDDASIEDHTAYGYTKSNGEVVPEKTSKMIFLADGTPVRPSGETKTRYTFFERRLVKPEKPE